MPYIPQNVRVQFGPTGNPIVPGELNYVLTRTIAAYVTSNGLSYQTINDVLGALTGAKDEFYRRVAVPYEDCKIEENGDVYDDVLRLMP